MTIKIETEIINQRLLVILSENIPPNDVPITPAIPFTRSANETNDISWPLDKISGFIKTNVTEFAINTKNVIIKYFATSAGLNIFEVTWFSWDGVSWFTGPRCISWSFGK